MVAYIVRIMLKNKTIARKKLTQEEIRREVIALQDMGHKRLALEAGEHPSLKSDRIYSGIYSDDLQYQT
mgnify:CR=1 FL=1